MPSTSIVELFAQDLLTRLALITTGNGYEVTVGTVARPLRVTWEADTDLGDLDIIVEQGPRSRGEDDLIGGPPGVSWVQQFAIYGFRLESDTATNAVAKLNNEFAAAIEAALAPSSAGAWWSSYIVDAAVTEVVPLESVRQGISGFRLTFEARLRWAESSPYTNRV